MAINFPNPATLNQTYTVGTKTWVYNGYAWDLVLANTSPILNVATSAFGQANAAYTQANTGISVGQGAFAQANTGVTIAQAGFGQANTGVTISQAGFTQANTALTTGQNAFSQANAAYSQANTGISVGQGAFSQANAAYTQANTALTTGQNAFSQANAAYTQANTGISVGQGAFGQANTGVTIGQAGFTQANTGVTIGQGAFSQANAAYTQANTALTTGQNAFGQANAAYTQANTGVTIGQGAFAQANSEPIGKNAFSQANAAYTQANTGITLTQAAFGQANSAYNTANTKFSANGGTISGSVTITSDLNVSGNVYLGGNVTTLSSNNLSVNDPLIYLAQDNPANLQDIGFVGHFNSDHYQHTGFARDASDGVWKLFSNVSVEPTQTIDFTTAIYDSFQVGTLTTSNATFSIASGSAPFIVNSVTLVNNLNADLLDGQHGNYYTGLSNSANTQANLGIAIGQGSFGQANSGFSQANAAYTQANTALTTGQNAFSQANAAYAAANTVSTINLPTIRPSLLLDFANRKKLDPRITFTRANTATYFDSDGLLKTAAINSPRFDHNPTTGESLGLLIEESRTNLLTYSEDFDNAAWIKSNATVTSNATTAPDGTVTADKLVEDGVLTIHQSYRGITILANTQHSFSVYVKSAERTQIQMEFGVSVSPYAPRIRAIFNLSSMTVTAINSGTPTVANAPTITDAGNGWVKCSISGIFDTTSTNPAIVFSLVNGGTNTYQGDGTSGIFIWGAQLEVGSFPTSYIPSADSFTSRASSASFIGSNGLIQSAATNVARYNYNPLNLAIPPKLLLEPAATNLLTYSEQFDNPIWENGGGNLGIAVTANNAISPDGTTSADKITNDAGGISLFQYSINVPASSTNDYTASIFVKAGTATRFVFNCYYVNNTEDNITFDLTTGTILGGNTLANQAAIIAMGNGWYRISYVLTRDATGARTTILFRGWGINSVSRGNGVIGEYYYAWGAQLEIGTLATSYIQTVASQVTRAADVSSSAQATRAADNAVMTGTNFSSWYRQDEGTIFVKQNFSSNNAAYVAVIDKGIFAWNSRLQISRSINANFIVLDNVNDSLVVDASVVSSGISNVAFSYKNNDYIGFGSGTIGTADSSVSVPTGMSRLVLGASPVESMYLNGRIAKLAYYPKRLANTELQAITTA